MKNIRFSSNASGVVSASVAASQNGQSVSATAGNLLTSGGSLTVHRPSLGFAPEPITIVPVLPAGYFDSSDTYDAVTDTTYSNGYNPARNRIEFYWDTGDTGTYSKVTNTRSTYTNKRYQKGPLMSYAYGAGTFTPSVVCYEPSSGKSLTITGDAITVVNADTVYATTQTICVNPVGDADFTGAPTGATQINTNELETADTEWTDAQALSRVRWLFKRGGTFGLAVELGASDPNDIMFGAYGSGARPIINHVNGSNSNRVVFAPAAYDTGAAQRVTVESLDIRGGYEPDLYAPGGDADAGGEAFRINVNANLCFNDTLIDGFKFSSIGFYPDDRAVEATFHVHDCQITDFGGQYPIYFNQAEHADSAFGMTGTAIVQKTDARAYVGGAKAPIRIQNVKLFNAYGNDIFHVDPEQPCFKVNETPEFDGTIGSICGNSFEGGVSAIYINHNSGEGWGNTGNPDGGQIMASMIVDGNVYAATYASGTFSSCFGQGVVYRNNLCVVPSHARISTYSFGSFIFMQRRFSNPTSEVAPIRSEFNTWVMIRDDADNASNEANTFNNSQFLSVPVFSDVSQADNINHQPNVTFTKVASAPLISTGEVVFTPRNAGHYDPSDGSLTAGTATGATEIQSYRPDTGSAAIGAGTVSRIHFDAENTARGGAPDEGALQS